MNQTTIKKLNDLNQAFYQEIAQEFSESRGQAWAGWDLLLPSFKHAFGSKSQLTILDVGCGNGRFGKFISDFTHQNNGPEITYIGLDNNQELLDATQKILASEIPNDKLHLIKADLLNIQDVKFPVQKMDLICLFGVLHHIPTIELSKQLLTYLAEKLAPDGLLIFAAWQFDKIPSIWARKKNISEVVKLGIDPQEMGENDYILDWERGKYSLRYCHLMTDAEIEEIVGATHLQEVAHFFADGPNDDANRYVILKK